MIDCEQMAELLPLDADNETTPQERKLVEDHLNECEDCRTMLAYLRQVDLGLRALPTVPERMQSRLPEIDKELTQRIHQSRRFSPPRLLRHSLNLAASLAMILVAGALVLGLWVILSQMETATIPAPEQEVPFTHEQAIIKATEQASQSRPGMDILEVRIDSVSAELMTLEQAWLRLNTQAQPAGYGPGRDADTQVWWVGAKGYFRYEGTRTPDGKTPTYESTERYFIYDTSDGEEIGSGLLFSQSVSPTPVATPTPTPAPGEYRHNQYGFGLDLPDSWQGYTVVDDKWTGYNPEQGNKIVEQGPLISIRHPQWTTEVPRQDIPIMVFTLSQWDSMLAGEFHIGAAPMNPRELARNSRYVFALPSRYNYAFPEGFEEVEEILEGNPLLTFEPIYPGPTATPTPSSMPGFAITDEDAAWDFVLAWTQDVAPILRPQLPPADMDTISVRHAQQGLFQVEYRGDGKRLSVGAGGLLSFSPFHEPEGETRTVMVRGQEAFLGVVSKAQPSKGVVLQWNEPTQSEDPVHIFYLISAEGVSSDAVLQIAESLQPVNVGHTTTLPAPCAFGAKGDVQTCADPFRLAWRDKFTNETGYRIELYYSNSKERFTYTTPANTTTFVFPSEVWPPMDRTNLQKCFERKDHNIFVYAITPDGEQQVGSMGAIAECSDQGLPSGEILTIEEAKWRVRAFLGEPQATVEGRFQETLVSTPGVDSLQRFVMSRHVVGVAEPDTFTVDARTGEVTEANLVSNTPLGAPRRSISEEQAEGIATEFALTRFAGFSSLAVTKRATRELDGSPGPNLYSVTWNLVAGDSGAILPTFVEVDVDLRTGSVTSYRSLRVNYQGPIEPTVSKEQAMQAALAEASRDSRFTNASASVTTLSVQATSEGYRLAWSVLVEQAGKSDLFFVDALKGEVLNPLGTPRG